MCYVKKIQVCGLQRGGVFSEDTLPYLWKWNASAASQINSTGFGDVPPNVLLRTALSILFGNKIGGTIICQRIPKEDCLFVIAIYIFIVVLIKKV